MREIIRQKIVDSLAMTPPSFTRRDVHLPGVAGKAVAVIGMRRSGKTTFLWQILNDRLAAGVPREGLLYFSFEDERLAGMTAADLSLIVEEYYRLYPEWRDAQRTVLFLDEIQVVPGWETFVRRILDAERVEVFLSGSSARLLSHEVASSMRGRAMEAVVYPFSFREYLRRFGHEPQERPDHLPKAIRSTLEKDLRDYLACGGFPEAVGASIRDRSELLRSYVDVVLLRDVVERYNVSHPVALRWLVRQLLGNAAGSFSVNKFYNVMRSQGLHVSKDTLHTYLGFLQDAFMIRTIEVAAASERGRMVNPRKVYPIDPGLILIFDLSGRANLGHALETVVFLELERRGAEIAYVRTEKGLEVDFLARYPDGRQELIQACLELSASDVREREVRALFEASAEHPQATLHLITLESLLGLSLPPSVNVHLASSWLLEKHPSGETQPQRPPAS